MHEKVESIALSKIDTNAYGIDLLQDEPIGFPWESRVFTGKDSSGIDIVCKVYQYAAAEAYQRQATERMFRYQAITKKVSGAVGQIHNPEGVGESITWEVVLIDEIGEVADDDTIVPCAISTYVDGLTVSECEAEIRAFLVQRGLTLTVDEWLRDVTKQLRALTGENSVTIVSHNVKPHRKADGYRMVITDVCAEVKDIIIHN